MKRSYYRLARLYHPDRVEDNEKDDEKFNIIHNAYTILSDSAKKDLYDKGSSVLFTKVTVATQWENFLKEIDQTDICNAREKYQGSMAEKNDIQREVLKGNRSLTHLLNNIPFMRIEDQARITGIVKALIENGDIPKITIKKIRT